MNYYNSSKWVHFYIKSLRKFDFKIDLYIIESAEWLIDGANQHLNIN